MQGFIVNDAAVTGINTGYVKGKRILLQEDSAEDPKSRAMPTSCYLSHLELQLDEPTAGVYSGSAVVTQVSAFMAWDSDGDDPLTAESASNATWDGMTNTSIRNASIALDVWVTMPTGATAPGKCALWIKVNAGEVSVLKARLHWCDRANV